MRVFYVEASGTHWLGISRRLEEHGVIPVLWSGDKATIAAVAREYPNVVGIVGVEATCARAPRSSVWTRGTLDAPLLERLAADEAIALSMMDRMDDGPGRFDHDSRRRHWHDLLRIWSAALEELRPDVIIFSMSPHAIYDYALYALCKLSGVPTLMFERAMMPGQLFLLERFEDGSAALARALGESCAASTARRLPGHFEAHLAGLRGVGNAALPPNYLKKLATTGLLRAGGRQGELGLGRWLIFEAKRLAYILIGRQEAPPNYLMRTARDGSLRPASALEWLVSRWRGQYRKMRLRRLLARLACVPELDKPSILLALHYQPERAMVPLAGAFGDQTLIVDLLASCLPQGWQLIVKEHPWQLAPMGRGELGRSAGFYRRISNYSNVVLCEPHLSTMDMLERARAVVTATGSIGWQAVARGKPAILFGAAWYRGCPGTYFVDSAESCRSALADIARGLVPPTDAAERMMAAIEQVSFAGYLEPGLEAVKDVPESKAVDSMSAALWQALATISQQPRAVHA